MIRSPIRLQVVFTYLRGLVTNLIYSVGVRLRLTTCHRSYRVEHSVVTLSLVSSSALALCGYELGTSKRAAISRLPKMRW